MKKFFVIFAIAMFLIGCGEEPTTAETVLYQWNVESEENVGWHPAKTKGRDVIILKAAMAASPDFAAKKLEPFESDDLVKSKYLAITFDDEHVDENTVIFSQKGLSNDDETEVKVQKHTNETWTAFYKRGFKELVTKGPGEEETPAPPPVTKKSPNKPKPPARAGTDGKSAEAEDAGVGEAPEELTLQQLLGLAGEDPNLLSLPIYFNWEPGNEKELALVYHPYVVEGLDRTVLLAATNLGIEARKLLKLDVEDFNAPQDMVIISYAPENLKSRTVQFLIRIENKVISTDVRLKNGEDWLEFYERGLCAIGKKAKILDCKVRYKSK